MRTALYARVSTEEQALHGLSIEAQLAALREAFPNGEEYVDLGISARKPITKRPELQRLLRDVEAGKIDLVVFTKLDRWTRNIREYYKCQDVLDAHGVAWRALHEDYETQTAAGRLKVNIMLAVAQDEADRTSERIKAVFENKRQKGLVPTGSAPLGVKIEAGHYSPSDDAYIVKKLFADYIGSRSLQAQARKYGYTGSGIRKLLKNRIYVDVGIIDAATWETANNILQTRSSRHGHSGRVYLFSGLVFCPYCGARLAAAHGKDGNTYYRCHRHYDGKCPGIHVREDILEEYLLAKIIPVITDENIKISENKKRPVNISALKAKRDKLTDLYMDDLIDKTKYTTEYKTITEEIEAAERQPKPVDIAIIKSAIETYNSLSETAKKAFWSNLLRQVIPSEDGYTFTLNST